MSHHHILFTGASSFTGYWFAKALHEAGHTVVAPLKSSIKHYTEGKTDARAERVKLLGEFAEIIEFCPFGSEQFLELCKSQPFGLLCHHAARVGDYKSLHFDMLGAAAENTHNIAPVLEALAHAVKAVVLTGSIFEAGEGVGTEPLSAFSPYAVSKTITGQIVEYHCQHLGIPLGRFVIPNVFGPLQEPRFYDFILNQWKRNEMATITTPDYVRDHVHVDLLAMTYARYCAELANGQTSTKINPSLYAESMRDFAERMAKEIRTRTARPCPLTYTQDPVYTEPMQRVNTDPAAPFAPHWHEEAAWNALAAAYFS